MMNDTDLMARVAGDTRRTAHLVEGKRWAVTVFDHDDQQMHYVTVVADDEKAAQATAAEWALRIAQMGDPEALDDIEPADEED